MEGAAGMKCDCLNECGDDPWLRDGRVKPCDGRIAALAKAEQRRNDIALVKELATRMTTRRNGRHAEALMRIVEALA
jgi:hypothetical protein